MSRNWPESGDNPALKIICQGFTQARIPPAPQPLDNFETGASRGAAAPLHSSQGLENKIYPPGPGKEVAEQVCMVATEKLLPTNPASEAVWNARIELT